MKTIRRNARLNGIVLGLMVAGSPCVAAQGMGPHGATAKCNNGKYSTARSMRAACEKENGIAQWYGLAPEGSPSRSAKPDVFASLEAIIAREPPFSVIRADPDGAVILRSADSSKVAPYLTLTDYLDKDRQESACRRSSNHCVTCRIPGHRIYCTNVPHFLPLPPF